MGPLWFEQIARSASIHCSWLAATAAAAAASATLASTSMRLLWPRNRCSILQKKLYFHFRPSECRSPFLSFVLSSLPISLVILVVVIVAPRPLVEVDEFAEPCGSSLVCQSTGEGEYRARSMDLSPFLRPYECIEPPLSSSPLSLSCNLYSSLAISIALPLALLLTCWSRCDLR